MTQSWFTIDPFQEMVNLRDAVSRLFEESFVHPGFSLFGARTASTIPFDVTEREQGYELRALVPGLKPDQLELSVKGTTLTIKGQLPTYMADEESKQVVWHLHEIPSGEFSRSITLPKPFNADQIQADYQDGILSIWVPFDEALLPRRIPIQTGQSQPQLASGQTVEAREPVLAH